MLRRFSCGHPSHNSVHTRPAVALSFQEQFLLVRHMTQSRAERGAGDKHTSSFTCSPASQGARLLSSERTRISFELGFFDTIIHRSRLAALLDSTPFSSSSLTATSWSFERNYWAEGHSVEHSAQLPDPPYASPAIDAEDRSPMRRPSRCRLQARCSCLQDLRGGEAMSTASAHSLDPRLEAASREAVPARQS